MSEAIWQQIARASRDATIVVDRQDAVLWANDAAHALNLEGLRHGRLVPLARSNLQIARSPLGGDLVLVTIRELEKSPPLAAEIAHELASPLNTLGLALDLMQGPSADRAREEARRAVGQLVHLLGDLRVAAGAPATEATADVRRAAEEAALAAAPSLEAHRAQLSVRIEPAAIVHASQGALERVLTHLVVHAAEAMDARSGSRTIRIESCVEDPWLAIDVVDTGTGIAPGPLERVFETGDGGIGLAICKRLVAELGGTLELRSRVGVGTCARVRLRPA